MTTVSETPIVESAEATLARGELSGWRERLREELDLFIASDPGANRLINSISAGMSIGLNLLVIYLFEQWTHLMWTAVPTGASASQQAALAEQHHGITILMMLLGGIIGMIASNIVQEAKARQQAISLIVLPVPMIAAMSLAIWLAPHHWVGVEVMAVVLAIGTWLRRFVPKIGTRAVLWGAVMFIGYMIGFLAEGEIYERDLGDITIVLLIAVAGVFAVKCGFSNPLARGRLGRTAAAFRARCRAVMAAELVVFDAATSEERAKASRRLHRSLRRLNETALLIDASLAEVNPDELDRDAATIQDELFGIELLVQNIARICERLAPAELPLPLRSEVRSWLDDLRLGQTERVGAVTRAFQQTHAIEHVEGLSEVDAARVRRLAMTIRQTAEASRELPQERAGAPAIHNDPFSSPVTLMMGDLPGSALLARQVASGEGPQPWWRRIDPASQTAIRMAIAVAVAGSIASVVSERRFYWAVIAVFITFMGANTAGEQVIKSANRVLGTIVGILLGSLLAHAIGLSTWSLAVVLPMMMLNMYFIKVSYGIAVIGITVSITQLYVQLGEYSNSLLLLRLGQTGIGAAVAMAAALLIFPVPTRGVVRAAARSYVQTLKDVLGRVRERLGSDCSEARLVSSVRGLDFAASQLAAASRPLHYTPYKPRHLEYNVALLAQTAHQSRNIAAIVEAHDSFAPLSPDELTPIIDTELAALSELTDALSSGTPPSAEHRVRDVQIAELDKALRDADVPADCYQRALLYQLDRLDETIAELNENLSSLVDQSDPSGPDPARPDRGPAGPAVTWVMPAR